MDWSNQVVLITGASSGIGRALAFNLARRGARLGLMARREELLAQIAAELRAVNKDKNGNPPANILSLPTDVQDAESVRAASDRLLSEFGRIDVLIANAGISVPNPGSGFDAEKAASVINVNVLGVVNCVAAVLPDMLARGSGCLAVISSLAAYRGLPKSGAYCASKAAVSALFESLRLDLEPRGITVTIIHPGFIKTPLTADRQAKMPFLLEVDDAAEKMIGAIEKRKRSYAFPWQLATIVRVGMIMPNFMYDWFARRNSYRD